MDESLITENLSWARSIGCHAARHVPARVNRDDVAQEAILGLMEAAGQYDPSRKTSFRTFAVRHVKGRVIDYIRRQMRLDCPVGTIRGPCQVPRRELIPFSTLSNDDFNTFDVPAEHNFDNVIIADQINYLLKNMESRLREFIILRLEGLTHKEISRRLGVSEAWVSKTFSEIIDLARQRLKGK